ncbi:hypothetical protein B5F76_05395 [Desulfovibrio sp. An276]|uniref:hypothetical protein n=1 Tax=Desulfovibrio sp. An276 TaxID=1965618 RepID=UPI000B392109|nr:hypothetical protein [Desulfovibrio sp. An276]OUO53455.1 hypothetical protein B5F76_05395 [Desulfovibrio sp. An276]
MLNMALGCLRLQHFSRISLTCCMVFGEGFWATMSSEYRQPASRLPLIQALKSLFLPSSRFRGSTVAWRYSAPRTYMASVQSALAAACSQG